MPREWARLLCTSRARPNEGPFPTRRNVFPFDLPEETMASDEFPMTYRTYTGFDTPIPFSRIDSFDFVEVPPYLRGFEAATPACYSYDNCFKATVYGDYAVEPQARVYDYGMYVPEQATTLTPYDLYPTTPHSTFYVHSALETGLGRWGPYIHAGNPGKYGVVAVSDGVRSAPLIFNVINKLVGGSIEITTEPDPCLLPWRASL